tara:strand:- start:723 stop:1271 length:549 start_codon:yes stop_codon:yes gene_type:complete
MKICMTGGYDYEKILKNFYEDVFIFSKRDGINISKIDDRKKIVEQSLKYDIFINHAYNIEFTDDGVNAYFYQIDLLNELILNWKKQEKNGFIINTGSNMVSKRLGKDYEYPDSQYISSKKLLQDVCLNAQEMHKSKDIDFKVSILNVPGLTKIGGSFTETDFVNSVNFIVNNNQNVNRIDFN